MTPSLQEAISLARSGQKENARALFIQIIQQEPRNETAWLWLVDCLPNNEQRIEALARCVQLIPDSQRAAAALEALRQRQEPAPKPPVQDSPHFPSNEPTHPKPPAVNYPTTGEIDANFLQEMVDQAGAQPEAAQPESPVSPTLTSHSTSAQTPLSAGSNPSIHLENIPEQPSPDRADFSVEEEQRPASSARWLAIIALLIFVILVILIGSYLGLFSPNGQRAVSPALITRNQTPVTTIDPSFIKLTQTAGPKATQDALSLPTQEPATPPPLPTLLPGTISGIKFSAGPDLPAALSQHTLTLLKNGQILIVGGSTSGEATSSSFLFDPKAGIFTPVKSLNAARLGHAAVLMDDGRVLVVGGKNPAGDVETAEIFDPVKKSWSVTRPFFIHGTDPMTIALDNGLVMVAGGCASTGASNEVEFYNPLASIWVKGTPMPGARCGGTATMLDKDVRVLIVGGTQNDQDPSAILYNIQKNIWASTTNLFEARSFHTATQLVDKRVVVTGGLSLKNEVLSSVEAYDPLTNIWTSLPPMPQPRYGHTAIYLSDQRLALVGGKQPAGTATPAKATKTTSTTASGITYLNTVDVYFGGNNIWAPSDDLGSPRADFASVILPDGRVLISGGTSDGKSELFTTIMMEPATGN